MTEQIIRTNILLFLGNILILTKIRNFQLIGVIIRCWFSLLISWRNKHTFILHNSLINILLNIMLNTNQTFIFIKVLVKLIFLIILIVLPWVLIRCRSLALLLLIVDLKLIFINLVLSVFSNWNCFGKQCFFFSVK